MGRHILHVDQNCFYASVEMQRHPELRDKPLAVCGSQEERHGIVLAANYVAKPFGVKTGMAVWQAKQRCPHLVTLPPDMGEYIRFSQMAREIFEDYTDQIEPFGLDESWLDITGSVGMFGSPMTIAREISRRIKFELGITCSIGVSDNKITAKLGSDYKKPDAITRIERDNYRELVYPLPVEDLLYVGPATSKKLRGLGIGTIGRLAQAPTDTLTRKLGKMGMVLQTFALGLDPSPVRKSGHIPNIKSVGNSATTPRDMTCDSDVELMLLLLAESVASRMRELASRCTVVEVSVRDVELNSFCRQRKLETPTCSSDEIARTAYGLFRQNYRWVRPLRSIGVRGAGLVEATAGTQLSFYPEDARRDKWERIDGAVDHLRQRYGYRSIQRARLLADPLLGAINPKDDHTVHPVGYFGG
ncbi:DNA polymerase IV [Pseudoflavonifractor phocaeensis]|uniref:DNA polymerase IV n=1 Tax=Pseudoflavonifractor phocaeensis TaxID=1870988 RepID=UPI00195E27A9|nr:DNA polymerase IV [Pseudoflavonifractor phocaeensis]MBM6926420.1 DNA polymerase IV [Pseudoflavonifractor phocaeensis]